MSCPHCYQAECAGTATLLDGNVVCTWSEAWRHECEARHILAIPTLAQRRQYLFGTMDKWGKLRGGIQQRRGDQALRSMQELVTALWRKNNNAAGQ